jgi:hypothetical protein
MLGAEKKIHKLLVAVSVLFSAYAVDVHAATDGDNGEDSTATSDVTVTIPELIQITNVGDIALGTFSGSGLLSGTDNVCIYRNNPASPNYRITATDSNGGADFAVADGGEEIAYAVYWNDAIGARGTQLTYNTALVGQANANTSAQNCGGTMNARFDIEISEANLIAAVPGSYSATLTLFVEPL